MYVRLLFLFFYFATSTTTTRARACEWIATRCWQSCVGPELGRYLLLQPSGGQKVFRVFQRWSWLAGRLLYCGLKQKCEVGVVR